MSTDDLFSNLLEFSWRGVSFPIARTSLQISQDLVQHKFPDTDGAHVEGTGRAPLIFSATCLFRNNITKAKSESWATGGTPLYPNAFRAFLTAFGDRTTGQLQHPELGFIACKPQTASMEWLATLRDGVDVQASWIETIDGAQNFADQLAAPSPLVSLYIEADDLDNQLVQYANPLLMSKDNGLSFLDAIRKIGSVFDQISLLNKQYGGYIDHVLYRVQALQDSVMSLRDNSSWPIINTCERLKSSLFGAKKQLLLATKDVSLFICPKDQTLAALCAILNNKVSDLVKLNPALGNSATVSFLTPVRYYKGGTS